MWKLITLFILLAVAVPGMAADEKSDSEARARSIVPFLDDQVIAVACLDLSRIDVDDFLDRIVKLAKLPEQQLAEAKQLLQPTVANFRKAGGKEVYAVFSLADLPTSFFVIVPLEKGTDARALANLLGSLKFSLGETTAETIDGALFAGSKMARERIRGLKAPPRPELARAFAAAGNTPVQLLLLPSTNLRRAVDETMPTLPQELGGGSSKVLTRGVLWVAAGLDLPPKTSLRLVFQATDAGTAQDLARLVASTWKTLRQSREVQAVVPPVDRLINLIDSKVMEDRLQLNMALSDQDAASILQPILARLEQEAGQAQVSNSLKQIALALHNYHAAHESFPAAASYDKQGKPLLSWRVHVLPYLGEEKLYKEFHLHEPWDSEHNKNLLERMPAIYRRPGGKMPAVKTLYLAPLGEGNIFQPGAKGSRLADIKDGTSNTILIVAAADDQAVFWTRPDDLKYNPDKPLAGLGGPHGASIPAVFADGSVHFLPPTIDPKTLQALFSRAGGEVVSYP